MSEGIDLREAAARLIPLHQGKFDSLCGLYSILNAIRLASWPTLELHHYRSRQLFNHGVAHLEKRGLLRATLKGGMIDATWRKLGDVLIKEVRRSEWLRLARVPLLTSLRGADLDSVLAAIDHHTRHGSPVLMPLYGGYNHFTVIVARRDNRLILFDSWGYRWISIASCQLESSAKHKRHRLGFRSAMVLCQQP